MSDASVVADLHVHTTASDGTLALEDVIAVASANDLDAIAITDHDRIHPELPEPITKQNGLTVIRGIEIKTMCPSGNHVDVLGYGVRSTPALETLTERIQTDRRERARRMCESLETHLNLQLDLAIRPGIGRPHIARAVAEQTDMSVQAVFDELIGDERPCHISRDIPDIANVSSVLSEAADLVALAHPLRYDDVNEAIAIATSLGAIERWYPYAGTVDTAQIDTAIARHGLVATGGSDAHSDEIGSTGLEEAAYATFAETIQDTA